MKPFPIRIAVLLKLLNCHTFISKLCAITYLKQRKYKQKKNYQCKMRIQKILLKSAFRRQFCHNFIWFSVWLVRFYFKISVHWCRLFRRKKFSFYFLHWYQLRLIFNVAITQMHKFHSLRSVLKGKKLTPLLENWRSILLNFYSDKAVVWCTKCFLVLWDVKTMLLNYDEIWKMLSDEYQNATKSWLINFYCRCHRIDTLIRSEPCDSMLITFFSDQYDGFCLDFATL